MFAAIFAASPALAQNTGTIVGTIVDASSGATISGADVEIIGQGADKHTKSDAHGGFSFSGLNSGPYVLNVAATGYSGGNGNPVTLAAGETLTVSVALHTVSVTTLRTIANVRAGGRQSVNSTSAPTITITKQDYVRNGQVLIQQALEQTPGVTVEHYDGGPGAVSTMTIRGAGGFAAGSNTGYEVLVLQDGEPMRNGQYGDADLSTLTPSIYSTTEVLKGVGGTSLFGANSIGGTLNLVTIDPNATEGGQLIAGFGSFGTSNFDLSETNTFGRFGYVVDVHSLHTDGWYPGSFLADYNTPATFCNTICLWHPTQAFNLTSDLLKMKYQFSPATYLVLSGQSESDRRDQVGLLGNPSTDGSGNALDPEGIPYFYGYPGDYVTNTQPKISADLHTRLLGGDLVLRSYGGALNRVDDGSHEPPGDCCYLQRSVDRLYGDEVLWDKSTDRNELTLGYGANGDSYFYGSGGASAPQTFAQLSYTGGSQIERTSLLRDRYELTPHLNIDATLYYSSYDTLQVKRFDPRLGLVYRPDASTAVRFSYATGFAPPRLSDLYTPLNLSGSSSTSDPRCPSTDQYCVASSGNPNLKSETAVGYDLGMDKTFMNDRGRFSFDLYRTNLHGHIFSANFPAPAGTMLDNGSPALFINQPINLAGSVYQGFEASARIPIAQNLAATGYYTTQSAYPLGVDYYTQANAGDLVNNQQYEGVPLHQAGYGLEYLTHSGFEVFGNAVFFDQNNSYQVPSFWEFNAGAVLPMGSENQLNVSLQNIGNKNATIWSLFNGGTPYPGINGPYLETAHPFQPTTLMVTFSHRWGSLAPKP